MKTIIITSILLFIVGSNGSGQNLIAVQNDNNAAFYSNLDTAIAHANNGDYIYVPGGSWTLNNPINKGVNIVGVGYFADSTVATALTQITTSTNSPYNTISIVSGADNGSLTGIYFNNAGITFGTNISNQNVNNYSITRCRISLNLQLGQSAPISSNLFISQNIIEGQYIQGLDLYAAYFSNNIISQAAIGSFVQSTFVNNIFLYGYFSQQNGSFFNDSGCVFSNNIFLGIAMHYCGSDNLFYNNLFVTPIYGGVPVDGNSIWDVPQSSIFINQSGNNYDPLENYHLQISCPGHNYGTDGTDVGIYGGSSPWKEGAIPYNPHIIFKNISGNTDANGNLPVNIKVEAQDH